MANQSHHEGLKRNLLLGFMAVCIVLIGLIWADGLSGSETSTPAYYRDTYQVDDSIYLTVTAEAVEFQKQLTRTPSPNMMQDRAQDQKQDSTPGPNH